MDLVKRYMIHIIVTFLTLLDIQNVILACLLIYKCYRVFKNYQGLITKFAVARIRMQKQGCHCEIKV